MGCLCRGVSGDPAPAIPSPTAIRAAGNLPAPGMQYGALNTRSGWLHKAFIGSWLHVVSQGSRSYGAWDLGKVGDKISGFEVYI